MTSNSLKLDLLGVGIGPFNLSVAALASSIPNLQTAFFDRKPQFSWHAGLGFRDSVMQTSYLKDMVTPVNPTSSLSFLNFLVTHGRFNDFLAGRFGAVSRIEFTEYMRWVTQNLPSCHFDNGVTRIDHDGQQFVVETARGQQMRSAAITIGTGQAPRIPKDAPLGRNCFHGSEYLHHRDHLKGKRIVVVGGGQTGAEIVLDLMDGTSNPTDLVWLSRRSAFWHLQEGSLVDQIFTPAYRDHYRNLSPTDQVTTVAEQKFSSDGLTPETADAIYKALYRFKHLNQTAPVSLRPGREVVEVMPTTGGYRVSARSDLDVVEETFADVVILATGFRPHIPDCLAPLQDRLEVEPNGSLVLDENYRVIWDGPETTPIYALNHGRASHGIVDPQLSLAAWRAGKILEDATGQRLFDGLHNSPGSMIDWGMIDTPVIARKSA
ncbi:hypothetical protein AL073_03220 [Loktanella sp. 1ANDIMAR09]|nr:hypothetical protein AL073_03220 [Loktanella sp. 1ANDIMAR09]